MKKQQNSGKRKWQDIMPVKKPLVMLKSPKQRKITIAAVIIISAAVGTYTLLSAKKVSDDIPTPASTSAAPTRLQQGTPDFSPVLPGDKKIEDFGGWTRVSPSSSVPVYAFADVLDNSPIRVSQQPIPQGFKGDEDEQVKTLALDFNAREVVMVDKIPVYIGTSVKGPQSLIFVKNNLLILIRSSVKIDPSIWSTYISSLN
jgi:hypothetical protein